MLVTEYAVYIDSALKEPTVSKRKAAEQNGNHSREVSPGSPGSRSEVQSIPVRDWRIRRKVKRTLRRRRLLGLTFQKK